MIPRRVVRIVTRILLAIVLLALAVWAGDYSSLRWRIPKDRGQFGSVQVRRYYAVPLKSKKTEYMFDQEQAQECVHSIFPHFGDKPCWYLERHTREEIDVPSR